MMTAPHQAAFASVPENRATPAFESTQRTPPIEGGFTPPPPATYPSDRPRARRGGSGWWVLIGLSLLLGAGLVVVLVVAQSNNGGDTTVPTTPTVSARKDTGATSPTMATNDPLPTLHTTTTIPPGTSPHPTFTDGGPRADAGADGSASVSPFPSFNIPPFVLPDGSVFTFPSGFPTFPPLFPPPP